MSDNISLLSDQKGNQDASQPKKQGNIYVMSHDDGSTTYYPSTHADSGNWIPYLTAGAAKKANDMNLQDAQSFQVKQQPKTKDMEKLNMAAQAVMSYQASMAGSGSLLAPNQAPQTQQQPGQAPSLLGGSP